MPDEDNGARVVLWDPNKDHKADRASRLSDFFRDLDKCNRSGTGFRMSYTGEASPDAFEMWSRGVWEILDGNKLTYLIVEEYSDCCRNAGPLSVVKDKFHRRLWTQSRKYGGIILATSQRPQLISKDALDNVGQIWASNMGSKAAKRIGDEIGIGEAQLKKLTPGNFYHWGITSDAKLIQVFTPI